MRKFVAPFFSKSVQAICFVIGLLLMSPHFVHANSPLPPSKLWFIFEYQIGNQVELQGVQLIKCVDPDCQTETLIQKYKTCDTQGCFSAGPDFDNEFQNWGNRLRCSNTKCLSTFSYFDGGDFRLIVQFSDKVRKSVPVSRLPDEWGQVSAWKVIVSNDALTLSPDPGFHQPLSFWQRLGSVLPFSIFIELVIATFYLLLRMKRSYYQIRRNLLLIGLVNLVTFPVVWWLFPNLSNLEFYTISFTEVYLPALFSILFLATAFFVVLRGLKNNTLRRVLIFATAFLSLLVQHGFEG